MIGAIMQIGGDAVWRRLAAVSVAALAAPVAQAEAAVDLPSVFSVRLTQAVFARDYGTVWGYLHPAYQKVVSRSAWERCERSRLANSAGVEIKSVRLAGVRLVPTKLPLLGRVIIEDVGVQVLYTERGSKTLRATTESAFWVKYKGKWRTVWPRPVYSAYKAGQCFPTSLY